MTEEEGIPTISKLKKMAKEELIITIKEMELMMTQDKKELIRLKFFNRNFEEEKKVLTGIISDYENELIRFKTRDFKNGLRDKHLEKELDEMNNDLADKSKEKSERLIIEVGKLRESGFTFSEIRQKLDISNTQARNIYNLYKYRKDRGVQQ